MNPGPLQCPSAQPDWRGASVIGVVGGTATAPPVLYLRAPLPIVDVDALSAMQHFSEGWVTDPATALETT